MVRCVSTTRSAGCARKRSPAAARWSAAMRSVSLAVLGLACAVSQTGCGSAATSSRRAPTKPGEHHAAKRSPKFAVNLQLSRGQREGAGRAGGRAVHAADGYGAGSARQRGRTPVPGSFA